MGPAKALRRIVDGIGDAEFLEKPAAKAAGLVRPAFTPALIKNTLSGVYIGHKAHPPMTDVVIGSWLSASLVDLFAGRDARGAQDAADRLVATGILAAVPTAAAGLSDYTDLYNHARRVAFVHAIASDIAVALQVASLIARRRGSRGVGVACSMGALGVVSIAGYLGGHLSYVLGVGVDHTAFDEGPEEWVTVAGAREVGAVPIAVTAGGHDVLVARVDGQLTAMANRCSHAGWPIVPLDGDEEPEVSNGCITCPYHGSVFRLADGEVVRGPAATAQLRYDVREVSGEVQVRGTR